MADAYSRWCIFCDAELHSGARNGPRLFLRDYWEDMVARVRGSLAFRVYERDNRIMRIADARVVPLPSGSRGLALVFTLGDRRGASPSFLHFTRGAARDPEREEGEVKGRSAHAILELAEDQTHVGRHRFLLEDVPNMGRTPVTRLLQSVLRDISKDRDERFKNPETGGFIQLRPAIEIWPQQSRQMQDALERGRLSMVELYDVGRIEAFDELPEFTVKRRTLKVEVGPSADGLRGALERLKALGHGEGYRHMKVGWRLPDGQVTSVDVRTDIEDLGTALLARRELVTVETAMSEATDRLNPEFVGAMAAHLV